MIQLILQGRWVGEARDPNRAFQGVVKKPVTANRG